MADIIFFSQLVLTWIRDTDVKDLDEESNYWPLLRNDEEITEQSIEQSRSLQRKIKYMATTLRENYNVPVKVEGSGSWAKVAEGLFNLFDCNIVINDNANVPLASKENLLHQGTLEIIVKNTNNVGRPYKFQYKRNGLVTAPQPPVNVSQHNPISTLQHPFSSINPPIPSTFTPPTAPFERLLAYSLEDDLPFGLFDSPPISTDNKKNQNIPTGVTDASVVYNPLLPSIHSTTTTVTATSSMMTPTTTTDKLQVNLKEVDGEMISIIPNKHPIKSEKTSTTPPATASENKKSCSSATFRPSSSTEKKKSTSNSSEKKKSSSTTSQSRNKPTSDSKKNQTKPSSSTVTSSAKRKPADLVKDTKPYSNLSSSSSSYEDSESEPIVIDSDDDIPPPTYPPKRKSLFKPEHQPKKPKTIKNAEKKADEYVQRQVMPLQGFEEGDIQAQENFRKVSEDYRAFMGKLIDTSRERAARMNGFLHCHSVYEKVFTHMKPHLEHIIKLPAQLEEDQRNAEKFHTQITTLAKNSDKSKGCNQTCGSCCSLTMKKRLQLVIKADQNHENLRKTDLEKRKEEQRKRENELKEEIEEIKRKLHRDTRR